jgi:hypothetical protein
MTRSKFLELVGAYIDGEISQSEEEQLREEIRKRPERALVLASYERMNAAARAARFPSHIEPEARKFAHRTTLFWCISGAAACAAAALAVVAAIGVFSHKTVGGQDDYCVLSGDFTVNADTARAKPSPAGQFATTAAIRSPALVARPDASARLTNFSVQQVSCPAIREQVIPSRVKFDDTLQQDTGAFCMPASYEQ